MIYWSSCWPWNEPLSLNCHQIPTLSVCVYDVWFPFRIKQLFVFFQNKWQVPNVDSASLRFNTGLALSRLTMIRMKRKVLTFLVVVGSMPVTMLILLAISSESKLPYKWATAPQNQQHDLCVPSEDLDQPGHPPSLIRVFAVRPVGS